MHYLLDNYRYLRNANLSIQDIAGLLEVVGEENNNAAGNGAAAIDLSDALLELSHEGALRGAA